MSKEYKYKLENERGTKKVICPECGRKSLTLYVDEATGEAISNDVGRCDHESSCGYHYTPSQYFHDHPDNQVKSKGTSGRVIRVKKTETKEICLFPDADKFIGGSMLIDTTFHEFLRNLLPVKDYERVCRMYRLGGWHGSSFSASKENDRTIFWQIDKDGKGRTGKAIVYGQDGHRIKKIFPSWMHCAHDVTMPEGWEVSQCLFGEHLLSEFPDKIVVLVEAEKTAMIGSAIYPDFVWVATGGMTSKMVDKCQALSGRKVIIYPDIDGHQKWCDKAKDIESSVKGCQVIVSDLLKTHATSDEVSRKIDIADWMVEECQKNIT